MFSGTNFLQQVSSAFPNSAMFGDEEFKHRSHEGISYSNHSAPTWYTMVQTNVVLEHSSSCRTSLTYHTLWFKIPADVLNEVRQMWWWYSLFFEIKFLKPTGLQTTLTQFFSSSWFIKLFGIRMHFHLSSLEDERLKGPWEPATLSQPPVLISQGEFPAWLTLTTHLSAHDVGKNTEAHRSQPPQVMWWTVGTIRTLKSNQRIGWPLWIQMLGLRNLTQHFPKETGC